MVKYHEHCQKIEVIKSKKSANIYNLKSMLRFQFICEIISGRYEVRPTGKVSRTKVSRNQCGQKCGVMCKVWGDDVT